MRLHRNTGAHAAKPSRTRSRALVLVGGTAAVAVLATGVAYAFWTANATGTATIGSTGAQTLVVASITTPLTDLYPGKSDDLGFKVTNPNPYNVQINALTAATVASSDQTNCPASNITLPAAAVTGMGQPGGWTGITPVNVNAGLTATGALTGFITMAATAPNGCQNKTFTVTLSFTGTQQ